MQSEATRDFEALLTLITTTYFPFITPIGMAEGALSSSGAAPIDLIYDDQGLLLSRLFERADGLLQEDGYVDGVRSTTQLTDIADVFDWADVTNIYDESGRVRKETTFDDGLLRVDTFQDGVRLRAFQTDPDDVNLVDWTTRDVTYDANGTALTRLTRYDDGTDRLETFQDGAKTTVVQEDLTLSAHLWSVVEAFFDSLGRLKARDLTFDDGVIRFDTFSAGVRQKTALDDDADQFDWKSIQYLYDPDGVVTSRQQVDDSGDLTLILFDDGQRSERIILDVDDSESWEVQITTYDNTGVSAVTEYDERGSVLDDYAPFFMVDTLVL